MGSSVMGGGRGGGLEVGGGRDSTLRGEGKVLAAVGGGMCVVGMLEAVPFAPGCDEPVRELLEGNILRVSCSKTADRCFTSTTPLVSSALAGCSMPLSTESM